MLIHLPYALSAFGGGLLRDKLLKTIEGVVTTAIRKLYDLCGGQENDGNRNGANKKSDGAAGMDPFRELREAERRVQAAESAKTALYEQYCDGAIDRDVYIRLRDAETCALEEAAAQLAELRKEQEALHADDRRGALRERLGGVAFDGTLTKELADALVEKVLVYDGGRVEIVWKFADPVEMCQFVE